MKNRILSAVLAATLILTSGVTAFATPNQEVIENQKKYEDINKKIEDIQGKIYSLNMQIDPLVAKMEENEKKIKDIKEEVENTKKDIEESKKQIEEKEEVLGNRVRELYKTGGQSSYLALLFSADSFSDLITKIDSSSRLVKIDKKVVNELLDEKEKLDKKVASLEANAEEIAALNEETKKTLTEFDSKKKEQEILIAEAKVEQDKFDAEYLSVSERALVKAQYDMIDSVDSSISTIQSAINQLVSIRDNQLKSPTVKEEVDGYIEKATAKIQQLEEEEAARAAAEAEAKAKVEAEANRPNRGESYSSTGNAIVDYAYQFIGTPYVYGGKGPDVFDCSGFTSYVYRHAAGIEIGGTTWAQVGAGRPVSQSELQPGDLVFTYNVEHVGIYIGGGSYIHAPQPGESVKVSQVTSFHSARRIL